MEARNALILKEVRTAIDKMKEDQAILIGREFATNIEVIADKKALLKENENRKAYTTELARLYQTDYEMTTKLIDEKQKYFGEAIKRLAIYNLRLEDEYNILEKELKGESDGN